MCEKKRRWLLKEERYVKLGFLAFVKFYRTIQREKNSRTYSQFVDSRYYTDFVKFGKYLLDINIIEPEEYIHFVISAGLPIKDWSSEKVYEEFIRYQTQREPADLALERSILLMRQWAISNKEDWVDYFRKIETPLAVKWIKAGRISPWVLYNTETGLELIYRLSDEQLGLVSKYINPKLWQDRFVKYPDEVIFIKNISKKAGF
jgi:hypothetical protein